MALPRFGLNRFDARSVDAFAADVRRAETLGWDAAFQPDSQLRRRDTYVLQVKGDSMIEEQIRDGDYVIVEDRKQARDGEMVIALLDRENVTLKKYFRELSQLLNVAIVSS